MRFSRFSRYGLLGLIAALPLSAGQSITLGSTAWSVTAPVSSPYTDASRFRIEGRIHGISGAAITSSSTIRYVWVTPGAKIKLRLRKISSTDYLSLQSDHDGSTDILVDITGRTDIVFRAQRNPATTTLCLEVWNKDGSGYSSTVGSTTTGSTLDLSGSAHSIGDTNFSTGNVRLAYFRWYSTFITPSSSAAPPNNTAGGDVTDWEFEGNGTDDGLNMDITLTGASFATTPTYSPAVFVTSGTRIQYSTWSIDQHMHVGRTGTATQLDACSSFSLGDNASLTYAWTVQSATNFLGAIGSPSYSFSNSAICNPTFTGNAYGTYNIRLTLTDNVPVSTTYDLKFGAVTTDADGIVDITGEAGANWATLLGPLVRNGVSPWGKYDQIELENGMILGAGTPVTPGDTPLSGTITVTNGSTTVTGSGTTFQTTFGCTPSTGGGYIMIHYPVDGGGGALGRRFYAVVTCASQTSMVIDSMGGETVYDASANASGVAYAKVTDSADATTGLNGWYAGTSTQWDYYDTCLAQYSTYFRTSIDSFLTYARTNCDKWWKFPLDQGRSANHGGYQAPPRGVGLLGMMARAQDLRDLGSTAASDAMWVGIETYLDTHWVGWINNSMTAGGPWHPSYPTDKVLDTREQGYVLLFHARAAALHPDSGKRAEFLAICAAFITDYLIPRQAALGGWISFSEAPVMEPSGYFAWMQQWIIKGLIATYELNSNAATLTAITTAAGYIKDVANTVNNPSTTPSQTSGMRGVYYGTNYTTSSGVTRVTTATGTADALGDNTIQYGVGSRTVAEPSLYVLGWMYQRTGTTAWKTLGDELFAAAFCYSGTGTACDAGSGNFDDIKRLSGDPATSLASAQGKEHGLAYGAGMPGRYLALRITPTVTPTIPIRFSGNVSTGGNIRVQ